MHHPRIRTTTTILGNISTSHTQSHPCPPGHPQNIIPAPYPNPRKFLQLFLHYGRSSLHMNPIFDPEFGKFFFNSVVTLSKSIHSRKIFDLVVEMDAIVNFVVMVLKHF